MKPWCTRAIARPEWSLTVVGAVAPPLPFFDKSTHGHLLTQKFEIVCFCDGLDPSCSICKGTGRYMAPIDELLDHLMERAQLDKEVAKLKRKGCTVALITDSKVYGLTTSMSSEEAVRAAATGPIKEIIKEVHFI